jgi:competence protein ComEC
MRTILFLAAALAAVAAPHTLNIYQIDVEGGKAMLVVSPSGESMLVDAGWPPRYAPGGRDVERIRAAMEDAGLRRIDNLLITHLDIDHLGDLDALTSRIEVGRIIDNGALQSSGKGVEESYAAYAKLRARYPHLVPAPGDRLPLKGVEVRVLTAATRTLGRPLKGAGLPNGACAASETRPEIAADREDNMSIGLLYQYGRFRLVDLADLEWAYEMRLMCPRNPVGAVDVYVSSVHAQAKAGSPALVHGLAPRVVMVNNGARKGGDAAALEIIRRSPGLEDVWQVHASVAAKALNPPDDFIANLEEPCAAKWIKLSARADGSFTITNGRNGYSKDYRARH